MHKQRPANKIAHTQQKRTPAVIDRGMRFVLFRNIKVECRLLEGNFVASGADGYKVDATGEGDMVVAGGGLGGYYAA